MTSDMGFKKSWKLQFLSLLVLFCSAFFFPSGEALASDVQWQEDQIIVNYASEEVEKVITRCEDYKHLFKHIARSKKLTVRECYLEAEILGHRAAWMQLKISPRSVDADKKTVRFTAEMVKGDIKFFVAKGKLVKLGPKKTLVVLRVKGDPGIPGVPDAAVEHQLRKMIRDSLIRLNTRLLLGRY